MSFFAPTKIKIKEGAAGATSPSRRGTFSTVITRLIGPRVMRRRRPADRPQARDERALAFLIYSYRPPNTPRADATPHCVCMYGGGYERIKEIKYIKGKREINIIVYIYAKTKEAARL